MRLRAVMTLLIGAIVAGSAVVYSHAFLRLPDSQQAMRDVVVATDDIPFGHAIKANMLALKSWPADAVPHGAYSSIAEIAGNETAELRRAKYALAKGDILLSNKISDFGEQVSITQKIAPSMRAMTIRVNDVTGVAGFIAPSDRINLTLTRTVDQNLITSTILQDIEVLGIDQTTGGARDEPAKIKTVTVQVEPADAQKLALAQQAGTLSLSLRHIDAADQPILDSISVSDLTDQVRPRPKKLKRRQPSIVVNRAGQRITIEVPSG